MKFNRLNTIMLLGLFAIAGILIIQLYLLRQAVNQEEGKFRQKVHVALQEVVKKMYEDSQHQLPELNPIKEISEDYYIVNVNQEFNASVLEYYLKSEFTKFNLLTDFEYAIYNCETEAMVYGNYISFSHENKVSTMKYFPTQTGLVYYFAIHFPNKNYTVYSSLKLWIIFAVVMFFVLIIYSYSAFQLLQQKKYSALQKDFINNMTHEFKTPLSSILLSSNYLVKQAPIEADAKMKKYTEIIIHQARQLNTHVEKVLDLAKTESNLFRIDKEPIHPEKIIRDIAENIQLRYQDAIITVGSEIGETTINADPFHFTNLVYNLLDNSIKYSSSVPRINIVITRNEKGILLKFSDNGIGIEKKHLEHIFDKFYRVPNKKSNEIKGFGLGLFYVKKICLAHKWEIRATSEEGAGTTITILIPKRHE